MLVYLFLNSGEVVLVVLTDTLAFALHTFELLFSDEFVADSDSLFLDLLGFDTGSRGGFGAFDSDDLVGEVFEVFGGRVIGFTTQGLHHCRGSVDVLLLDSLLGLIELLHLNLRLSPGIFQLLNLHLPLLLLSLVLLNVSQVNSVHVLLLCLGEKLRIDLLLLEPVGVQGLGFRGEGLDDHRFLESGAESFGVGLLEGGEETGGVDGLVPLLLVLFAGLLDGLHKFSHC